MFKDFKENINKKNREIEEIKENTNGIFGAEKYIIWNENLPNEINSRLH